jgi:hypothetical protein
LLASAPLHLRTVPAAAAGPADSAATATMKGVDDAFLGVGDKPCVPSPPLWSFQFCSFITVLFGRIVLC